MSGDLSSVPESVDLLIVGAGLSGAVLAERCSKELGMTSLILDIRDHIGGNCYDYVEEHGLRASKCVLLRSIFLCSARAVRCCAACCRSPRQSGG